MRLHNLLTLPGGIPEQGREVVFRLRYRSAQGVPQVREVRAVMLPLSEEQMHQARQFAQNGEAPLVEGQEYVVRLLAASLRDPGDLAKLLIEDETDLRDLRAGLVAPQFEWLLKEYKLLIEQEYPAVVTDEHAADLEGQARDFTKGGQPGPG